MKIRQLSKYLLSSAKQVGKAKQSKQPSKKVQFETLPRSSKQKMTQLFGKLEENTQKHSILAINKQYNKRCEQAQQDNVRIKNYKHYQYLQGEDLIENIPVDQKYTYRADEYKNQLKQANKELIDMLDRKPDFARKGRLIKERVEAYHEKQKKYQMEQFEKYLRNYPGSAKGPNPGDDPDSYTAYAFEKMPQILRDQINEQNILRQQQKIQIDQREQDTLKGLPPRQTVVLTDLFSKNRDYSTYASIGQEEFDERLDEQMTNMPIIEQVKVDVPTTPNINFENYQDYISTWFQWISFRQHWVKNNQKRVYYEYFGNVQKLAAEPDEWQEVPSNIPSLYRYYKCLPKEIQDNPGLKDVYLGMEYMQPDFQYEEKEDALNYTARLILPLDPVSEKIMTDFTAKKKEYLTPFLVEKMHTMPLPYTWDLDDFFGELRRMELRGQIDPEQKKERYDEPPEGHKMWQKDAPNLPVDYYDNDDGFWDEVIDEKLRRYDECKPMLKTRRFFQH